jgi:hypothetical protein
MRRIAAPAQLTLGEHIRYPGCKLVLFCGACDWSKAYEVGNVIDGLRALRKGGYHTHVEFVPELVRAHCPACSQKRWKACFGYPEDLDAREARRLAAQIRS